MTTSEIATVLAWHDALNEQDYATLVALSSDDIEVGDVRGAAQGHAALIKWARSLGITAEPGRIYVHEGIVVVEQQVTAAAGDTTTAMAGDTTTAAAGDTTTAAAAFRVVHDHVTSVFRHQDLASALAATDLTEEDLAG